MPVVALLCLTLAPTPVLANKKNHNPNKPTHSVREQTNGPQYGHTTDVQALAKNLSSTHDLPHAWVLEQLSHARRLSSVPKLVLPPPVSVPKNWHAYRERFIEPNRIEAGATFWRTYADSLSKAEQEYGVPAEIIVGIIGVETFYGRNKGNYRVLDVLATLSLDFPQSHPRAAERQAFFRSELGHFLVQMHKNPTNQPITGSFAGAMGWPQFMPSSWTKFAVDFDGDGRIDLINNPIDAIGSVANYFKAFGWQTGMPTHYAVEFDEARLDKPSLLAPDILPSFNAASFQDKGALLDAQGKLHKGQLALVELFNGKDAPSYVAGTDNFYVVTRYNWSSYYAMAVIELGQAVKTAIPTNTQANVTGK